MSTAITGSNLSESPDELFDFYEDLHCTCAESIFQKCEVCEDEDLDVDFAATDVLDVAPEVTESPSSVFTSVSTRILESVQKLSEIFESKTNRDSIEDDPFYEQYADQYLSDNAEDTENVSINDLFDDSDYFDNEFYTRDEIIRIRKELSEKLKGVARFTELRPGTKASVTRFDDLSTYETIPDTKDYGVVPKKNLMILDIDSHEDSGTTVAEQIDMFSELLGVDLRKTFTVATPSGGIHAYLLIPEDRKQLPVGIHNLKAYSEAISHILGRPVVVDADLRSGRSSGYAVGPTSVFVRDEVDPESGKEIQIRSLYRIADESDGFSSDTRNADLQYISDLGFQRLASLRNVRKEIVDEKLRIKREDRIRRKSEITKVPIEKFQVENELPLSDKSQRTDSLPAPEFIRKVKREMSLRQMKTFHQRRAFVKAALHCCHSDAVIAQVCMDLDIDRDSSSQSEIEYSDLIADIARFTPSVSYHGGYCVKSQQSTRPTATDFLPEGTEFSVEELKAKNAKKVAERSVSRHKPGYQNNVNPRVLNVAKISTRLLKDSARKKPSQQYYDAMRVVDYFLQPLSNVGAKVVILARSALEERLELSPSRAGQAVRILREKGIISVVDKQRTGLAATYAVDEMFTHPNLTKTLRMLWGFNGVVTGSDSEGNPEKFHAALYLDRFDGVFREVFTERVVESDFPQVTSWLFEMSNVPHLPEADNVGAGAALSYLKSEAIKRGLTIVSGPDPILVEEETGEIVTSGADLRSEKLTEKFGNFPAHLSTPLNDLINSGSSSATSISTRSEHLRGSFEREESNDSQPP